MAKQRRKQRRAPATARPRLRALTRGPGLLLIAVLIGLAVVGTLIAVGLATQDNRGIKRLEGISAEGRIRGDPNAPVAIIEFGDYQCPNCKRFEEAAGSQIEETYIADSKVRLEFRYMAILGDESVIAAAAAECANEQGAFWRYHDKLFEEQRGENSGAYSFDRLKDFASDLGLDRTTFDQCVDSARTQQLVFDETDAAREAGVTSTPTFFINGEMVKGARSFGEFQDVIDKKLAEAGAAP